MDLNTTQGPSPSARGKEAPTQPSHIGKPLPYPGTTDDPSKSTDFTNQPFQNSKPLPWSQQTLDLINNGRQDLPSGSSNRDDLRVRVAETMINHAVQRKELTPEQLAEYGIDLKIGYIFDDPPQQMKKKHRRGKKKQGVIPIFKGRDFFAALRNLPELLLEVAKHLTMPAFISLYAISKDFHGAVDSHLSHTMLLCAAFKAPESAQTFRFTLYDQYCVYDPMKRPHPFKAHLIRKVPGLQWLQMINHREKTVHDILAMLAREGHRTPPSMSLSLKKMWLVMDIATSAQRVQVMHAKYFTQQDLYNMQMFIVKLDMRFNDPLDGPASDSLRNLMLGQRGLTPLCKLLRRQEFLTIEDIVKLAIRYDHQPKSAHRGLPIWGIPPREIGRSHLEGWGKGKVHLMRPDELVMREAVYRGCNMKHHIMLMMLWGYVDPITGLDTPATAEEMWIDGDEDNPVDINAGWEECEGGRSREERRRRTQRRISGGETGVSGA